MKSRLRLLTGMLMIMPFSGFSQNQNCVNFDTIPLGTQFGNGINNAGDWIMNQNNVNVYIEWFEWVGGGGMFGTATVVDGSAAFGTPHAMWTNNVNLRFDFGAIGYTPNRVSFDYTDSGGNENFSVNGEPIFAGELNAAPTPPGITMIITDMGTFMRATLYGPVWELTIGGQEFQMDNICAMLIEDIGPCVEFETLPMGQEYGNGHNTQGEVILTENDIDVSVEYFEWIGGGGTFGTCHVIDGNPFFNTGQAMWTSNINLKFDFTNFIYTVRMLSFDFHDSGGEENFSLNGFPIFVGEIENWMLPPQFTIGITDMGTYKHVEIAGDAIIHTFLVGGQEYAIDNLCAGYISDPSDCIDFAFLAMGAQFGDGINSVGEQIFTENDFPVFVEWFEWVGGGGTFGNCWVIDGGMNIGTGKAMWTSNINLRFDFTGMVGQENVTFDFIDYGGNENISINGNPLYVGEITEAVLQGGSITIQDVGTYSHAIIHGAVGISELVIGGQEFVIDNVCLTVNPGYDEFTEDNAVILGQNYPNPLSGHTVIPFTLKNGAKVWLGVYDHMGREVKVLMDAELSAGEYEVNWDATGVASGIYFYQLKTGSDILSKKMVVE